MAAESIAHAEFDHIDEDTGELVFKASNVWFSVPADADLERAILEARQIYKESQNTRNQAPSTLPISQIQALIRAGADPEKVAEKYNLSSALVRRFSTAVETEKKYAIEQFLSLAAPKESKAISLRDVIERTLASARINPDSVSWHATRRGLEPWHISAHFQTSTRALRAEWSWDMHTNAIVNLNRTASKLLGDTQTSLPVQETAHDDGLSMQELPGNSVRSARIEQAVSAWSSTEPTLPAARSQATSAPAQSNAPTEQQQNTGAQSTQGSTQSPADTQVANTQPASSINTDTPAVPQSALSSTVSLDSVNQSTGAKADSSRHDTHEQMVKKRRSGRSAVPSWDEILFGE